ncbi:hypothetical protein GCM10027589_04790 [Actinocorallia lasiicapitis]
MACTLRHRGRSLPFALPPVSPAECATRRVTVAPDEVSETRGNTLMEDSRDDLVARLRSQEDNGGEAG